MNFSDALIQLQQGQKLYRISWSIKKNYIEYIPESTRLDTNGNGITTSPYLLYVDLDRDRIIDTAIYYCTHVWCPQFDDLFATDWVTRNDA